MKDSCFSGPGAERQGLCLMEDPKSPLMGVASKLSESTALLGVSAQSGKQVFLLTGACKLVLGEHTAIPETLCSGEPVILRRPPP